MELTSLHTTKMIKIWDFHQRYNFEPKKKVRYWDLEIRYIGLPSF
jgi:hypothetical protein